MDHSRAVLFLDFDNVFGGLHHVDPHAATAFAEQPDLWVEALRGSLLVDRPRRWLQLRCYLNPSGSIAPTSGAGEQRTYFSRFRPAFVQAGFEVVDCPRLTHTKNAADIRMVLDAADLIGVDRRCDEVVLASGDSDMTPLLHRLRAADLRTTILSPSDAARAFTSVADRLVGAEELLRLLLPPGEDEVIQAPLGLSLAQTDRSPRDRAAELLSDSYHQAEEPLNRSTLASLVKQTVPETVATIDAPSRWFGAGSFRAFLEELELPGMRVGRHHVWDERRHRDPDSEPAVPAVVEALFRSLDVPRLPRSSWAAVYETLAEYSATQEYSLTESTRWSRDRLAELGTPVGRTALSSVVRGVTYGGRPLHADPPPTPDELREAFVANVLGRADAADRVLDADERAQVRHWVGG